MTWAQWLLTGLGCTISGVMVWYAAYGELPEDLPTVVVGTLLAVGCFVLAFVGLEEKKETEGV